MTGAGAESGNWRFGVIGCGPISSASGIVIKIGGSILARSDWPERVAALLGDIRIGSTSPRRTLLIGGGAVVDGLRELDRVRRQPDQLMHQLAIDGMGITARLVAAALGLPLVAAPSGGDGVLDMAAWLAAEPGRARGMPAGWEVTSDSLSALVAADCGHRLVLVKSVSPPCSSLSTPESTAAGRILQHLADAGWVDCWFPVAAANIGPVQWAVPE
ncbi:MAG: hypothetical protein DWH79_11510 [Planctomycetota bacterium]|nr:MAG: hypothetical protein DWH79_11510 [Planctomycetota bacterium]